MFCFSMQQLQRNSVFVENVAMTLDRSAGIGHWPMAGWKVALGIKLETLIPNNVGAP